MKRREFANLIALMAGSMALPVAAGTGPQALSREFFEALVGNHFPLSGTKARSLILKKIEDACGSASPEQFHAVFEASEGVQLQDGTYQLECERNGRFDLYLAGSEPTGNRQRLVATVNRQTAA